MQCSTPRGNCAQEMSRGPFTPFSNVGTGYIGTSSLQGGLQGGPSVSSLAWDARNGGSVGQAAAFLNKGIPPSTFGTPFFLANDFIQQSFVLHPWSDGSHLHIAEYQIVCTNRSIKDHAINM